MAPYVMGALLAKCEPLSVDLGNKPLAEIFQFQSKGSLPKKEDIDRSAQIAAKRIFQSDLLVWLPQAQLHGELMLEIGLRTENRTPPGHIGHDLVDLDQSKLHRHIERGIYTDCR
ncbi:hypothetical protein BHE75_03645 [Sphingomonas haloaromaticamans]|uniref:Uncharacterized protein n=1 Tax=Edaphosphingomonas haloaromaticamans TaxID=653954 RepID=A0A1S1HHB2_9SPHN|nr:hypothetical protein BHE75_03645 [Sphingomonas haloaromaticamans]